jgi:3-oxoacyl-[acyl-carrier-protein] synthase II
MKAYIRSTGIISPQDTFAKSGFPESFRTYNNSRFTCVDPEYKQFIPPAAARRMSRILKMGVVAATDCLNAAGEKNPDAIITGTGMGCLEDTEKFLMAMIENNEQFLTPTTFIQSTHNTVAGQIALLLGCKNYNFTYVHRGFSFECSLADAVMMFEENTAESVLIGGIDELTPNQYVVFKKLNQWKESGDTLTSLNDGKSGAVPGEGATFFVLRKNFEEGCLAAVEDTEMVFLAPDKNLTSATEVFLKRNNLKSEDIDVVVTGLNGHKDEEIIHLEMTENLFNGNAIACFKHLCGEYPTASAFGMWFATRLITDQNIPEVAYRGGQKPDKIRRVLLCNNFRKNYFSLTLISQC